LQRIEDPVCLHIRQMQQLGDAEAYPSGN